MRASAMNLNARQADIDLTVNIAPLRRIPQSTHQLFEGFAMFRCIFEPREEVEGLAKLLRMGISAARVACGRESPCSPATRASTSERLV